MISVITVNYNNVDGLRRTMESVFSQTDGDYEFIIIDGGSKDGGKQLIEENAGKLAYWVSEPDKGVYNAMNKGIAVAKGDYCIFMNSGDVFHSATVLEELKASGRNEDILCGNTMVQENPPRRKPAPVEITFDTLFNSSLCHQAVFIRTSLMKKYGYDESCWIVADRKFFVQALILDNCTYSAVDIDVADYDITGYSAVNRFKSEVEYEKVLEDLFPARVLADYGKAHKGVLYGSSDYEKLFLEIGRRNYRRPVYRLTTMYLRLLSCIRKSAGFVKEFPKKI